MNKNLLSKLSKPKEESAADKFLREYNERLARMEKTSEMQQEQLDELDEQKSALQPSTLFDELPNTSSFLNTSTNILKGVVTGMKASAEQRKSNPMPMYKAPSMEEINEALKEHGAKQVAEAGKQVGKVTPPRTTKKGKQKVERTHDQGTKTKAEFFGQFRSAIRKIWMYSAIRREAVKIAKKAPNKYLCAHCKALFKSTEIEVNHIDACGSLREFEDFSPFISKMFQEDLYNLEVVCKPCHKKFTAENK